MSQLGTRFPNLPSSTRPVSTVEKEEGTPLDQLLLTSLGPSSRSFRPIGVSTHSRFRSAGTKVVWTVTSHDSGFGRLRPDSGERTPLPLEYGATDIQKTQYFDPSRFGPFSGFSNHLRRHTIPSTSVERSHSVKRRSRRQPTLQETRLTSDGWNLKGK